MDDNWSNLPSEILILICEKMEFLCDCISCAGVCKSWRNSVSGLEIPSLPPARSPFLLLAEDVAPGALISDCEYDSDEDCEVYNDEDSCNVEGVARGGGGEEDSDEDNEDSDDSEEEEEEEEDGNESEEKEEEEKDSGGAGVVAGGAEEDIGDDDGGDDSVEEEDSDDEEDNDDSEQEEGDDDGGGGRQDYNYLNNTIGSSRGLYSLLTKKTYIIDLPEAAGRLILGANKGWLVTLGRDLKVNLLHPLLRRQIPLPSMLSFPRQCNYHEYFQPEQAFESFIEKAVVSSKILNNFTAFSSDRRNQTSPSPIVMAIYGQRRFLGFARLEDKVWTDVKLPSNDRFNFQDIAYHKGNFYGVDCHGRIFVCGNDDNEEGGDIRGREIASFETKDWIQKYLVESSSGSGLWLLVRYYKKKYFDTEPHKWPKYRTNNFSIWRLDLNYSDSLDDISCTLKEEKYLGNDAIFIGKTSSIAVSSSEMIKPNSIYFTDDNRLSHCKGSGHDMGIFNLEHRTIEPHFPGKSIHPISPPLWYF